MSASAPLFEVTSLIATIRWINGYRYLDRCGEALLRLEERLDAGWATGEIVPTSGTMKNYRLSMGARFGTDQLNVYQQGEFISFEHFRDETALIYETLANVFEVKRINAPTFKLVAQHACETADKGDATIHALHLISHDQRLLDELGGVSKASSFVLCTEQDTAWNEEPVHLRRRFEANTVRQERQPDFDNRLMQRIPLLSLKDREIVQDLMKLRRHHPKFGPFAAQLEIESAFESEFSTRYFDTRQFLSDQWEWSRHCITRLTSGTVVDD
jgi:hypothetical protein